MWSKETTGKKYECSYPVHFVTFKLITRIVKTENESAGSVVLAYSSVLVVCGGQFEHFLVCWNGGGTKVTTTSNFQLRK